MGKKMDSLSTGVGQENKEWETNSSVYVHVCGGGDLWSFLLIACLFQNRNPGNQLKMKTGEEV